MADSAWSKTGPRANIHRVRSSTFARCLVLAAALGLITCREQDRVSAVLRVAPGLSPELARHLVLDSDAEFQAFAAACYTLDLRAAVAAFGRLVPEAPAADYERAYRLVRPYWGRASTALEQCFGLPAYARDLAHVDSLTVQERWKIRSLQAYLDSLDSRSRAGLPSGPAAVVEQVAWCEAGGHWRQLGGSASGSPITATRTAAGMTRSGGTRVRHWRSRASRATS